MQHINVNGRQIQVSGRVITLEDNVLRVDGQIIEDLDLHAVDIVPVHLTVQGNVEQVRGSFAKVAVQGGVGSVQTMSGDVTVNGDVMGDASTMSGDMSVGGQVRGSVSSMSGTVNNHSAAADKRFATRDGWLEPNQLRAGDTIAEVSGWGASVRFRLSDA